ncbi:MAG: CpsD/CapB family tyrosine-protein kinase [Clostridiales bacterium]|nr:CpsD/CapB family tyrosine-protein kinase [Candidatus Blautia equi]
MKTITINIPKLDYTANESYKSLRTNLLFCGEDKKVIAITSCTPNEGKSSVTLNLAASLAESGKKVLLVDADLRKSVLIGRTEVTEEVLGLSHLLSKQESLENVVYATNYNKLHIIYAGKVPPNPAELLSGKYFKEFLSFVRPIYDYILIDTPPLGSVIDSAIIADECDGSVVVVEAGTVSYRFVQEVIEQLNKSASPILGVILNKVDMHKNGFYGKYYGRYYGKYGSYGKDK